MFNLVNLKGRYQTTINIIYFGVNLYDTRMKQRNYY